MVRHHRLRTYVNCMPRLITVHRNGDCFARFSNDINRAIDVELLDGMFEMPLEIPRQQSILWIRSNWDRDLLFEYKRAHQYVRGAPVVYSRTGIVLDDGIRRNPELLLREEIVPESDDDDW